MDKRYQVFISSTYADLKEERRIVMQAVLDLNCIPAGMELFPAADEQQFEYIKRVIDDSDYYVLVIGGRYGTTTPEGISYTEKEYEYAVSKDIKVIAFVHEAPGEIAYDKSELEPELRERLQQFREKVSNGRLIKAWKNPDQLANLVTSSLSAAIRTSPAIGWVRADKPAGAEVLAEINDLRKKNDELISVLTGLREQLRPAIPDLAGLDDEIQLHGSNSPDPRYAVTSTQRWKVKVTWHAVFAFVAPYLLEFPPAYYVKKALEKALFQVSGVRGEDPLMADQDFQTVTVQLKALGLVDVRYVEATPRGSGLFWSLTPTGEKLLIEARSIRKSTSQ